MSDKILRAALIGVGNMGKKYVQMIVSGEVSNIKLTAVVIRRDELMEWGETLVNTDGEYVKIFRSADDMFKAEDVDTLFDAVIIATPHKTHAKLAVQAFSLAVPMKQYLSQIGQLNDKKVFCFITQQLKKAWMGGNHALRQMQAACKAKGGQVLWNGGVNWSSEKREEQINNIVESIGRMIS